MHCCASLNAIYCVNNLLSLPAPCNYVKGDDDDESEGEEEEEEDDDEERT